MTLPRTPLHILVAPLDWGLGHTSRCVPIIRHLLARGCRVTVAGTASQQSFYQQTFLTEIASGVLRLHTLAGYDVRYAKTGEGFLPRILRQVPRILRTVRAEHRWLRALVEEGHIDGILSDNRYGLHHPRVSSVILTHQLSPRTGMGTVMDGLLRRVHYCSLQKFDACWVVDTADAPGLSSTLAHPALLPRNARYIGLLSQFSGEGTTEEIANPETGPLLILLSGPEPQRTLLSEKLWAQVQHHKARVIFVEGKETASVPDHIPSHITHYRRLTSAALKPLLEAASIVICRSGYSTLMDLVALGKRAIIIPTPGQTEQVYLARTLHERGVFSATRQENFSLPVALAQANAGRQTRQAFFAKDFRVFSGMVDDWLATFRRHS